MAVVYCTDVAAGGIWTGAATDFQTALTAAGAGGTVCLADTHEQTYATNTVFTFPAGSDDAVLVISCDITNTTAPSYKKATTEQLVNDASTYDFTFDGSCVLVGVYITCGDDIVAGSAAGEINIFRDCTLSLPSTNAQIRSGTDAVLEFSGTQIIIGDTAASAVGIFALGAETSLLLHKCTFSGTLTNRNSSIFTCADNCTLYCTGVDFSGFTNASLSEIVTRDANTLNWITLDGCKAPTGKPFFSTAVYSDRFGALATRGGDSNSGLAHSSYYGATRNFTRTRTGGANDGGAYGWEVVTTAKCRVGEEYYTPWINAWVGTTGAKTFTLYIANDAADLKTSECWLEVEYFAAASTVTSSATDRATDPLNSGTDQTDDTTSTWSTAMTYMQSLATAATLGKAGMVRCRVGFAAAEKTVYIDPKVTVS